MSKIDRRAFIAAAGALGATPLWARGASTRSRGAAVERRDLFPEGVASGDPDAHSVLLWTRRPFEGRTRPARLSVEIAADLGFRDVVATREVTVAPDADWTCRVIAGGLKPATTYWYRFVDEEGFASRVGRTRTAPTDTDSRPVRFAFVACQNANQGAQNAYRRMIWEDDRAAEADRLGFVLHLGDFIYEMVWYPKDRPQGMYDRRLRDIVRYPTGEKIKDYHIPVTTEDYRAVYKAYLHDPDVQDARARFPFVNIWDNHEFSVSGWQGIQAFGGRNIPAQTRKVAANQAWFEFQPARVSKPSGPSLASFGAPQVSDAPILSYDDDGLGIERNNLAAIRSLTGYRAMRWGSNVEIILTDQHSYRSEDLSARPSVSMPDDEWLDLYPEEAIAMLDAGRSYGGGKPPAMLPLGAPIANLAREAPPQTILGATQKKWFKERLLGSRATWKIWGNTLGTLDYRADPMNLPAEIAAKWPGAGYACFGGGDPSTAFVERREIYDAVRDARLTGFATLAGDRHSFWAGYAAAALPPLNYEPVGVAFVTASLSAPGLVEANEHSLKKDHPLRGLYLADRGGQRPEATINLTLRHGVRTALEYASGGNLKRAVALSNPAVAPHLAFVDMAGHGYSVVTATAAKLSTEFVCVPRPLERSATEDGGPLRYRVTHATDLWSVGETPKMVRTAIEGDAGLSAA